MTLYCTPYCWRPIIRPKTETNQINRIAKRFCLLFLDGPYKIQTQRTA